MLMHPLLGSNSPFVDASNGSPTVHSGRCVLRLSREGMPIANVCPLCLWRAVGRGGYNSDVMILVGVGGRGEVSWR